jgi:MFS family permease
MNNSVISFNPTASLSNIGQLLGSLISVFVSSRFGRKRGIIFFSAPLFCGWVTVLLSGGDLVAICIGRVLQGAGIMTSVTAVYLVEIAHVKRREDNRPLSDCFLICVHAYDTLFFPGACLVLVDHFSLASVPPW